MNGAQILMFPHMPRTKSTPDRDYPNRVRELRIAADLTLKQLAELSGLFFTQIHKIEVGERPAKDFEFRAIAKALNVAVADLVNLDEGGLAEEERLLVDTYRDLPPAMKRALMAMVESQQDERTGKEVVELEQPAQVAAKKKGSA